MKKQKLISICLWLTFLSASAQKIDIGLDYSITYVLEKTKDTVNLSIGDSGRMIFTDSRVLAKQFGSAFNSMIPAAGGQTEAKFLLDLQENKMFMEADIAGNIILMNLDIINFIPKPKATGTGITIKAEPTDDSQFVLNGLFKKYNVFSSDKEGIAFKMAFDENFSFNYEETLGPFLQLLLGDEIAISLPKGIILYAEDSDGNEVLRAIRLRNEEQRIKADFNLNQIFPQ